MTAARSHGDADRPSSGFRPSGSVAGSPLPSAHHDSPSFWDRVSRPAVCLFPYPGDRKEAYSPRRGRQAGARNRPGGAPDHTARGPALYRAWLDRTHHPSTAGARMICVLVQVAKDITHKMAKRLRIGNVIPSFSDLSPRTASPEKPDTAVHAPHSRRRASPLLP